MPSSRIPGSIPAPGKKVLSKKKNGLRFLVIIVALFLAFAIGFFGHIYYEAHPGMALPAAFESLLSGKAEVVPVSDSGVVSIEHIEEIIKPASDLITTRYFYTDADIFEDYKQFFGRRLPFTTNKTVFTYEGSVGLGFDLSTAGIDIDDIQRRIILNMPEVQIVSNEINADSFRYFDVSNSVFNQTEMGDITELIAVLKEKTADRVMQDAELLETAKINAEQVLSGILQASGLLQDYTINFRYG